MHVRLLLISSDAVLRESAKIEAHGLAAELEVAPSTPHAERLYAESPGQHPHAVLFNPREGNRQQNVAWARGAFPDVEVFFLEGGDAQGNATFSPGAGVSVAAGSRADLRTTLERAIDTCAGNEELPGQEGQDARIEGLDDLIGRSVRFREALEIAMQAISHPDAPVLITGEKGTGKRLFARAIHAETMGARGEFVRIDCRAMNVKDLDAALSQAYQTAGHHSGTVASNDPPGTLFLEEISALGGQRQDKILKYILEAERHAKLRGKTHCGALRVMATTATNLSELERRGEFNASLLEKLSGLLIELPPLRERQSDILLLADRFFGQRSQRGGGPTPRLSREVQAQLLSNLWPGNIRELFGALEAALDAAHGAPEVGVQHLPDWLHVPGQGESPAVGSAFPPHPNAEQLRGAAAHVMVSEDGVVVRLPEGGIAFEEIEKAILSTALHMAQNNVVRAARLLQLGRGSLRYRLEKFKLVEPRRRRSAKRRPPTPSEEPDTFRRAS